MTTIKTMFSSLRANWKTPKDIYDQLDNEFHFDFDPCPSEPTFNGIFIDNWGKSSFVNPPYGKAIYGWLQKAITEMKKGNSSVFLLPARTDTKWFHDLVLPHASEIRFVRGRIHFDGGKYCAPFPSIIVVFKG